MFADSTRRDEVLYYLGRAYIEDGQAAKGREIFGQLVHDFPGSSYASDANKVLQP